MTIKNIKAHSATISLSQLLGHSAAWMAGRLGTEHTAFLITRVSMLMKYCCGDVGLQSAATVLCIIWPLVGKGRDEEAGGGFSILTWSESER